VWTSLVGFEIPASSLGIIFAIEFIRIFFVVVFRDRFSSEAVVGIPLLLIAITFLTKSNLKSFTAQATSTSTSLRTTTVSIHFPFNTTSKVRSSSGSTCSDHT